MSLSQKILSKGKPKKPSIQMEIHNLTYQRENLRNFQVAQMYSDNFTERLSLKLIDIFKNFNSAKFIVYKFKQQGFCYNFEKSIKEFEEGYLTERKSENQNQRVFFRNKNKLRFELGRIVCRNFCIQIDNVFIVPTRKSTIVKSVGVVNKDFQVFKCLALINSELSYIKNGHFLLTKMIEFDLNKKKIPYTLKNTEISYIESHYQPSGSTRVQITLSLSPNLLKLTLNQILPNSISIYTQEQQALAIQYTRLLNKSQKIGRFNFNLPITFTTSFHTSGLTVPTLLIQKDLDLFFNNCEHFQTILQKSAVIPSTLYQKSYKNFLKIKKKLTFSQYLKEKEIIRLLSSAPGIFFLNRFNYKKIIHTENNNIVYFVNKDTENFQSFSEHSPFCAVESIFALIDELGKLGLVFDKNIFPDNLFEWFEEKPVFTYKEPLCKLFNILEDFKDCEESVLKVKKKIFYQIFQFQASMIKQSEPVLSVEESMFIFKGAKFEQIDYNIACQRVNLYESNRISKAIKYLGLASVGQKTFLISSKRIHLTLRDKLENLNEISEFFQFFQQFVTEFLQIIESLVAKNTMFGWIDPESIGYTKGNKLILEIKAESEVENEYKAPEILIGRSNKTSLFFSFGKILEDCFFFFFCIQSSQNWEKCEKKMILEQGLENFFEAKELIKGCTEGKIMKRWGIEKVKIGVKSMLSCLIN